MDLDLYLSKSPRGTVKSLAEYLGVSRTMIYFYRKGTKKPVSDKAKMIETYTKGKVRLEHFFGKEKAAELRAIWQGNKNVN